MSTQKKQIKDKIKGSSKKASKKNYVLYGIVAAILITTFICYYPSLKNEFTNWDDPTYVTENKLIQKFDSKTIKKIFSPEEGVVSLNYHPITMLTLAYNYKKSKLEPRTYFVWNIVIHLLNTLLVFIFIYKLSNKNQIVAGITAAFFGLHPMHVESVAWVSERKDLLYTFFFISAGIIYLNYLKSGKTTSIIAVFVLFVLSCLSKAMAVSFVPVMFLIDYLQTRKFTIKTILEKLPFILLALLIGYYAVVVQSKEAMNEFSTFTLPQRFMFASYGFMMYISKLFVPYHLSAFYPYPNVNDLGNIPTIFYIAPMVVIAIIGLPILLLWKFKRELLPVFIFGMGFFIVTIVLVLQFISVGSAIMADRYSYISYIGIFFMLATIAYELVRDKKLIAVAGIVASLSLGYMCMERVPVWKNTETLWTDVIEKYPYRVEVAYKNRGNYLAQLNRLDEAYSDHETLIYKMRSKDAGVYVNFANICGLKKDFNKSLEAYSKALEVKKTDNFDIYLNRAITYSMMQQFDKALADFDTAATKKPDDDKLIQNRSFVYLQTKQYDKAITDYNELMKRFPDVKDYPFNRGLAKFNKGMFAEAIEDFSKSLQLKPDYKEAYFNISVAYKQMGKFKESLDYAQKAKSMGHTIPDNYLNELLSKTGS